METDATVGKVLKALEQSGNADDTLVIFTSDNGFASYVGAKDLEQRGHFPSGPLRGYKTDVYEGGHRVPFIVRWPKVVKSGTVCSQLVHHADVIATLAEILSVKLPANSAEDSFSLMPLLKGVDKPVRENSVSCAASGIPGLRQGDWKLILAPDPRQNKDVKNDVQLYNLAEDLGETKNLASEQPERVARMRALMEKLITDGRSSPGVVQKNDVIVKRYPQPLGMQNKKGKAAK
jgi:arylsulfatase A-like enzyme